MWGVSVLVNKSLPFTLLDMVLNPDGKYVIVNARILSQTWSVFATPSISDTAEQNVQVS